MQPRVHGEKIPGLFVFFLLPGCVLLTGVYLRIYPSDVAFSWRKKNLHNLRRQVAASGGVKGHRKHFRLH